jgi:hypothetical protein
MTKPGGANPSGYDGVGLTNLLAIGLGPSMAVANSYLAHSQSLSILLTNSVQQQHQQAIAGLATTSRSISQIFGGRKEPLPRAFSPPPGPPPVAKATVEASSFHHEPYHEPPYKEPPFTE